jgi:hypothetical protein
METDGLDLALFHHRYPQTHINPPFNLNHLHPLIYHNPSYLPHPGAPDPPLPDWLMEDSVGVPLYDIARVCGSPCAPRAARQPRLRQI